MPVDALRKHFMVQLFPTQITRKKITIKNFHVFIDCAPGYTAKSCSPRRPQALLSSFTLCLCRLTIARPFCSNHKMGTCVSQMPIALPSLDEDLMNTIKTAAVQTGATIHVAFAVSYLIESPDETAVQLSFDDMAVFHLF